MCNGDLFPFNHIVDSDNNDDFINTILEFQGNYPNIRLYEMKDIVLNTFENEDYERVQIVTIILRRNSNYFYPNKITYPLPFPYSTTTFGHYLNTS